MITEVEIRHVDLLVVSLTSITARSAPPWLS